MYTMIFENNIVLEDERALLQPLQKQHHSALLPYSIQEPEIWQYSLMQAAGSDGLRKYIDLALEGKQSGKEYPFVVFDKLRNAYAGSTRLYDIQMNTKTLSLGYTWYGKDFQGTGLNTHCKFLLLDFVFCTLAFERVEFRADSQNTRSLNAMKSIGCTVEGTLRSTAPRTDGSRRDSTVLSILKKEWENGTREMLFAKLK